ncbi:MAG: bifunctional phosphoribosyl-AMP cyclohydrolase/phosphoribosyl-ATP diphosphatase HisIE [Bacteriovoracaceae bacterium]|nr:bifunctional phosphoribosyl-AMP cyclohydrolase/phosphoribosyl-ATP diphosphatase HisIE [Bacteriovoracaceae bacterium]
MKLDFLKMDGLVPAIIQDSSTGVVLMLGYMNKEAFDQTKKSGKVTFFSRSKKRLWVKGETSGNFLLVDKMLVDCDEDTILIKATAVGPTCHKGDDSCFKESNQEVYTFLNKLNDIIHDRKINRNSKSYTCSLFDEGINKIVQKVGEEAVELVIEGKDDNLDLLKNEAADLIYHMMVLLEYKDISWSDVVEILKNRHK